MSYHSLYEDPAEDASYFERFPSREETIKRIQSTRLCDIVVVGGGIHGAVFAHLAALNGFRTVLFERSDYASGTSSRSSKMAHGGLRYLEMFDIFQVLEGIKAREKWFENASHLVQPWAFQVPIERGHWFEKLKLSLGLHVYDLLVHSKDRKHRWIPVDKLKDFALSKSRFELLGAFQYTDGIMNDARLTIENIVAARQEGAHCLNHASLETAQVDHDGTVVIGWRDRLQNKNYQLRTGIVVNCAGPWVPFTGRLTASTLAKKVRYSQGTHLLFSRPWNEPALFIPMEGKARYYFVWPHSAGTLVGTTEREIDSVPDDPVPSREEVEEILARLERDLPESGLNRNSLHYGFAGIRTLPVRDASVDVARVSRKHSWEFSNGILSLVGGKFTTAHWTALEGLKKAIKMSGLKRSLSGASSRMLPGSVGLATARERFSERSKRCGASKESIEATLALFGARVRAYEEDDRYYQELAPGVLRGSLEIAVRIEQSETLEDIMRRRLSLEYAPDNGFTALPAVVNAMKGYFPDRDFDAEAEAYKERIMKLRDILGIS